MGKRVFIGVVAALTAVVGTGVASARGPSPDWGPTACGVGGQTTAAWNKAKLDQVTFEWFGVGSNPDTDAPLDTKVMPVTTHAPKGSVSWPTTGGAALVRVFFAANGDPFPPFVDQVCS